LILTGFIQIAEPNARKMQVNREPNALAKVINIHLITESHS
jgi:hypothetical protein